MKHRANDRTKKLRSGAAALLFALTYLLTMTSCGSGEVMTDSYSIKSESMNGAVMDYEYGYEAEAPMTEMAYDKAMSSTAGTGSAMADSASHEERQNDLGARKLIMTANLDVETKEFDAFMSTLEANIASAGGYTSASSVSGNSYNNNRVRYANLTVRVPADTYSSFVAGVSGYGNVTHQNESVNDVTLAYVDTESRIKAYETEYATLLEILEKATSLEDVLVIQNRITDVTYQLESYRSQLRKYDDLISYCTVHLNISEVVELTEIKPTPMTVGERMARGWQNTCEDIAEGAEDFAVWFVTNFLILVIWAAVIVIAVLVIKGILRRVKRKEYERAVGKAARDDTTKEEK